MAEDLKLSENIEAEFNPLVVIVAEDPERYSSFASHLLKNGFKCEVHDHLPETFIERPTPGTVFFVSFNLKSYDATLLARRIEQKNNICIVFAEHEGFDTAAKLSSAKMSQTLQHPYTEKNFLMAVQTIVKKRKVQHEKDLRKQSVLDRRKGITDAQIPSEPEPEGDQVFKAEAKAKPDRTPLIFEERRRGKKFFEHIQGESYISGHFKFRQDRRHRGLIGIQKGLMGATFTVLSSSSSTSGGMVVQSGSAASGGMVVQSGSVASGGMVVQSGSVASGGVVVQDGARGPGGVTVQKGSDVTSGLVVQSGNMQKDGIAYMPGSKPELSTQEAKAAHSKTEIGTETSEDKRITATDSPAPPAIKAKPAPLDESMFTPRPAPLPGERAPEVTKIVGGFTVPTWALIAASSIGILFCLFFIYQMLFNKH
ncbi:MAG: hypothetical protein AAB250_09135 [Bdellovibrionota bacterium]